jgi:two-component system alkaline phosphatase synthesis response regulator PhoP
MSESARILVVDDNPTVRGIFVSQLTLSGYCVQGIENGEEALRFLAEQRFDLLITDLQLTTLDGVTVMREARRLNPSMAIIMVTGCPSIDSAIAALQNGARSYLMKPVRLADLQAAVADALTQRSAELQRKEMLRRIGADLLRVAEGGSVTYEHGRHNAAPAAEGSSPQRTETHTIEVGTLAIDTQRHRVTYAGHTIALSHSEFCLLAYLAQRREQVVSAQQLVMELQGYNCTTQEARDLIKARIWSLRQKIEPNPARPQLLLSVRGAGYVLTAEGRG